MVNLITLGDYGITWDEERLFKAGDAHLDFFSGKGLDLSFSDDVMYYGHFTNIISSAFNIIFGGIFKTIFGEIIGELAARHLILAIYSSIMVFILYLFALQMFDSKVAIISALCLALFPRFIANFHNNLSDTPVAFFTLLAIWSLYGGVKKQSKKWIVVSAVFMGLGLSSKITFVSIPLIILLWILMNSKFKNLKIVKNPVQIRKFFFLCPIIIFLVMFLAYPFSYYTILHKK